MATVQMIVICAMRQNQTCLVGAGVGVGVGVFQGSLLPLLVLMPVPELHPSPHNSVPPSNLPARGVIPCSFFNPGYYPGSRPERDSAFLGWRDLAERAQVSQVNKVSEVGPGDPLETVLL